MTGGLACGKSVVCQLLKSLGAHVVSADLIVHELLSLHHPAGREVLRLLGPDVKDVGDFLNREQIGKKVFAKPELLKQLERILHPFVFKEIQNQYLVAQQKGHSPLFVAEIPLLYECGQENHYDAVLCVVADEAICQKRKHHENFMDRSKRQLPLASKAERSDFVIHNNGSLADLKQQVQDIYHQLT